MFHRRFFWVFNNLMILLVHLVGGAIFFSGARPWTDPIVLVWLALVAIHALEIPVAFSATQERPQPLAKTVFMTLIFGFTWWLPVRLGIYGSDPDAQ
jgi:hypothetical protein